MAQRAVRKFLHEGAAATLCFPLRRRECGERDRQRGPVEHRAYGKGG